MRSMVDTMLRWIIAGRTRHLPSWATRSNWATTTSASATWEGS